VQDPLFWYRPVGEDGGYEGPLHNGVIEKVRKESGSWKPLYTTPTAAAPVQSCYCPNCEAMGRELAALKAQPAPVQCEWCNGRGVLAGHAQDGSFDGEDCPHCTKPAAQPAVPDAIHHTDLSESLEYIQGWNDCRAEMLKGMKP
jgi:hypothetical protein